MNLFSRGLPVAALLLWMSACPAFAAEKQFALTVKAGTHDHANVPAVVTLQLPAALAGARSATLTCPAGNKIAGQLTAPELLNGAVAAEGSVVRELHFILPNLKREAAMSLKAVISTEPAVEPGFAWKEAPGEYAELSFDGRPVMRYVSKPFDATSKESKEDTGKPFHHLYDPRGRRFVTNGGPDGLYPHHRGLFYGFSKIRYGDLTGVNTWAGADTGHQEHNAFVAQEAGPVLGRHRVAIDWVGPESDVFAVEDREMTAYHVPGGILVEFASRLSSKVGAIKLDGDPQHAGFQFRAANEVAEKTDKQTWYLRPDGKGAAGETRNWDHKTRDPACVNLPWHACSFVLGGQRYTCVYVDKPSNPKEARFSERSYARFGSYFEYELEEGKDLELNYRIWLQEGEIAPQTAQTLSDDFVDPVEVVVEP